MKCLSIFFCILGFATLAAAAEYGVAVTNVPVLNTPDFRGVFGGENRRDLKVDRCGQVRELEYIAPPGTVFTILKKIESGKITIYQIETAEYSAPPKISLYVDGRFLTIERAVPAPRRLTLPPREKITDTLRASLGSHYVWGGNVRSGVPELEALFYSSVRESDRKRVTLAGLDCSGLLYFATGGWTPRNTSQLCAFGKSIDIAGKQSAEIASMLQPLDLILWNGHVIIVLDRQTAIESRLECGLPGNGGVVITQLSQRIGEIMRTRRPANAILNGKKHRDTFVIRRWYDIGSNLSNNKMQPL